MSCQGLFGRLFGHKYAPVFNIVPPPLTSFKAGYGQDLTKLMQVLSTKTMTCLACQRCGDMKKPGGAA